MVTSKISYAFSYVLRSLNANVSQHYQGVNQFSWTMVKLKMLIDNSLDGTSELLNQFYKIFKRSQHYQGINQFFWTMVKLKILIGDSLDGSSKRLTNSTKSLKVTFTGNG